MDNELKRIAEIYRTGDHDYHRSDIAHEHAGILADAFLAEHPPDEDEPITPEWLNGLLPWDRQEITDCGKWVRWDHLFNGNELRVDVCCDWFTLDVNDDRWPIPLYTRGQLLRLLKELEQ